MAIVELQDKHFETYSDYTVSFWYGTPHRRMMLACIQEWLAENIKQQKSDLSSR